jgi:cellobiose-specific phosphotransferase system component IIA
MNQKNAVSAFLCRDAWLRRWAMGRDAKMQVKLPHADEHAMPTMIPCQRMQTVLPRLLETYHDQETGHVSEKIQPAVAG